MLNLYQIKKLANELHRSIITKFKGCSVYSSFKNNIWGADLAHMKLIIKEDEGILCLLCVIDISSKHAWVIPFKDKEKHYYCWSISKKKRKPNKIWADQGSEFITSFFKKRFHDNDIKMYSTYNEGKFVVAE